MKNADVRIPGPTANRLNQPFMNAFTAALVRSSAASPFLSRMFIADKSDIFNENMRKLRDVPSISEPTFTIIHSLPPHPPYLFDRNGKVLSRNEYRLTTGWVYTDKYVDQLIYVNSVVLETVDAIIAQSDEEPIIIIQGDHGPKSSERRADRLVEKLNSPGLHIH